MASPGDVIFLPGEISPRRDSPNYSCNIRYMVLIACFLHDSSQVYFRVAIEIPAVYASSITEGMWSLFNPSIAPRERRRKSVIAPNTEGNFLL